MPCGQALREVTLESTTPWAIARRQFANKMGCPVTLMQIGYTLPWEKKSKIVQPTLLQAHDEWEGLKKQVEQYVQSEQAKNRGRGKVKPFSISLVKIQDDGSPATSGQLVRGIAR